MTTSQYIKPVPNSEVAYEQLKLITDAAQAGDLEPWSPSVIDLLAEYNVNVERLQDVKAQANLSFPTSIKKNDSIAIGFRYAKKDGSFAEDLFVFEKHVGLTCYYRGTQEKVLPEYSGTHHAHIVLTELLPDFQREIADMKHQIRELKATSGVEMITDEMHQQAMQAVTDEFNQKVRSFMNVHGSSSSAANQYAWAAQQQATNKRKELMGKKARSDAAYQRNGTPEVALIIRAQANDERFEIQLINKSEQSLVAKNISINGIDTAFNQQFSKQFPITKVNIPDGIFDEEAECVTVIVEYQTLDGQRYELTQVGSQQYRQGDGRFNVVFPNPATIKALPAV